MVSWPLSVNVRMWNPAVLWGVSFYRFHQSFKKGEIPFLLYLLAVSCTQAFGCLCQMAYRAGSPRGSTVRAFGSRQSLTGGI
jgi:hypothetical protein